jgi:hypothetical protein
MNITQISVFLENKPGTLNAMTEVLANSNIDMRALYLAETTDFGIARLIVDDLYKATVALKEAGYVCTNTQVVGVVVPDEPGGLNSVLNVLSEAGINIEYMYAFLAKENARNAYIIFRVNDPSAASRALKAKGIKVVSQEAITEM